ncbi:hypothetical protein EVA_16301 [gut metagenome]|uniref:Uncharacterized protein n=1 Tax=gut metagenome TaxID=749906 RepID=J9G830_9ZZZZ
MKLYTILIKKTKAGGVLKDTEKDFGIVCIEFDMPNREMKELPSNEWMDEPGKDVYIPDRLMEKSYNINVKVGYKGDVDKWEDNVDKFLDYLTGHDGSGSEMLVYFPYHKTGRKCRLSKVSNPTAYIESSEFVIVMELEFSVDSPRIRVIANSNEGDITTLTERNK